MLKSKSFVKVNKKGNVVKVVKEHYLRDDIHCGLNCTKCIPNTNIPLQDQLVIIPDTNIFIHQVLFDLIFRFSDASLSLGNI